MEVSKDDLTYTQYPPITCHCDKWGVAHTQMKSCNLSYDGPPKPAPTSLSSGLSFSDEIVRWEDGTE